MRDIERLCERINEEAKNGNLDENLNSIILASDDGKSVTGHVQVKHDMAVNMLINTMIGSPQFAYSVVTAVEEYSKHMKNVLNKVEEKEENK